MNINRDTLIKTVRKGAGRFGKRELARELGLTGEDRRALREALKSLTDDGTLIRTDRKTYRCADALSGVMVLRVIGPDAHGDLVGKPEKWDGTGEAPLIRIIEKKSPHKKHGRHASAAKLGAKLGEGVRVLCRIKDESEETVGTVIKVLSEAPAPELGVVVKGGRGMRIRPVRKGSRYDFVPQRGADLKAQDLVLFELTKSRHKGDRIAKIIKTLGSADHPRAASLISLYEHNIPTGFTQAEIDQAKSGSLPKPNKFRKDIRNLPLITIDPVDARDFDDAVFAKPDENAHNKGGWIVWVAIADVSEYVTPGSPLDKGAFKKGNSVYMPDRVEPMLPEELSADLCSLRPHEDRACLAVEMRFNAKGVKTGHKFVRGLMRSHARLTYAQAQSGFDGKPTPEAEPVMDILTDLFKAYQCLKKGRADRAPLEIDVPERKVKLDENGNVISIDTKTRFDAHKLVEEFMIQANVAAAEQLDRKNMPLIYRVHEPPEREKVQGLADFLPALDLKWSMGERITTRRFNRLLALAEDKDMAETVGMSVLRTQSKAVYSPKNGGHFGLNLTHYAHFTSPIRRYADLTVHRALIKSLGFGEDGSSPAELTRLKEIADHISETERQAMAAERSANDRYVAAFLKDRVGAEFAGRIAGVTGAGLFVQLDETGADGFVPIRTLGLERFVLDEKNKSLIGAETGGTYRLGRRVQVRLKEAMPITGGLIFEILTEPEKGKPPKYLARHKPAHRTGRRPHKKHKSRR